MKQLIASIFALLLSVTAICQVAAPTVSQSSSPSTSTALTRPTWVAMHVGGGFQLNAGGWRERYNANAKFDLGAEYQHKEQWLVGFNYVPYTGGWVNTDSLYGDIISNANYLFDVNGNPAVIRTYMRGFNFCATGGKIIPLKQSTLKNPRTWSLQLIGGLGYHEHFTKFQFDKGLVPQLEGFMRWGMTIIARDIALQSRFVCST